MCQFWHDLLQRQQNNRLKWPDNHLVTKGHTWSQNQTSENIRTRSILFYPRVPELKVASTKNPGGDTGQRNDNGPPYTHTHVQTNKCTLHSAHIENLYLSSPSENWNKKRMNRLFHFLEIGIWAFNRKVFYTTFVGIVSISKLTRETFG